MNLKEIAFEEHISKRIYLDYLNQVRLAVKGLPKLEQEDILMEMNSHIYEGLQRANKSGEADNLLDVLEKLGRPSEVLRPLIADKKLAQATSTFNPIHVFKAIVLNITNGVSYIVFALLYLMLFAFLFLIFAKTWYPSNVGMYFKDGAFSLLGFVYPENGDMSPYTEVLGKWFIPAMVVGAILFYVLITLLLKLKMKFLPTKS